MFEIPKGKAKFLMGISNPKQLEQWLIEHPNVKGVALVGRSNVGKSSLINSIFGRKTARVSKTPGRTREINVFSFKIYNNESKEDLPEDFYLFDLPGYGFAKVTNEMSQNWNELMGLFFQYIPQSVTLLNIQDSRHPDQKSDREFFDFIKDASLNIILVLNKIDKLKTQKERAKLKKIFPVIKERYHSMSSYYSVSAESQQGISQLISKMIEDLRS